MLIKCPSQLCCINKITVKLDLKVISLYYVLSVLSEFMFHDLSEPSQQKLKFVTGGNSLLKDIYRT